MDKRYTPDNPLGDILKKENQERLREDSFGYSELVQKCIEQATELLSSPSDQIRILKEDTNFIKIASETDEDDRDDLIAQVMADNPDVIPENVQEEEHKLAFIQALAIVHSRA